MMNSKDLILAGAIVLVAAGVAIYLYSSSGYVSEVKFAGSMPSRNLLATPPASTSAPVPARPTLIPITAGLPKSDLNGSAIQQVLSEVNTRLGEAQTEEAQNELNGLLDVYDQLTDIEKSKVLMGYARYFMRNSYPDEGKFFYEASLSLPDLGQSNRLAVMQLLARFAISEEDWDSFLAYNDRYFAEGGEYNFMVTENLVNAYRRMGNFDAAGKSLQLQLETGIDPTIDGNEQQYQRKFGDNQYLPLMMTNPDSAITLAQGLVDQFDRIENWKVLADLYEIQDEQEKRNRTLDAARERGFIGSFGEWQLSDAKK